MRTLSVLALTGTLAITVVCAAAPRKDKKERSFEEYLGRVSSSTAAEVRATGPSLWVDAGPLADIAADYKSRRIGDIVTIVVVESTAAESRGSVDAQRKFSTTSGISGLAGQISTRGVTELASAASAEKLQGQGQTASSSRLRTRLTGRVRAVLPGGGLVVEAQRSIAMNNETQSLLVRGIARPGDVSPDNTVLSSSLSDIEVTLNGHGVVSDATRQPNIVVRWLLRILNF